MINIAILIQDNNFSSTIFGLFDVFGCANLTAKEIGIEAEFSLSLVSQNGEDIRSFSGHTIAADCSVEELPSLDVLIVTPALSSSPTNEEITKHLKPLEPLHPWLREQAEKGVIVAASCTASFLLAEAGILTGKVATTHWRAAHTFKLRYPEVILRPEELVTEDDKILCSGGAVSYIDLGLHLIRHFGGKELASRCASFLVVDPGRSKQTPYAHEYIGTNHDDTLVRQTQVYLQRNYWDKLDIEHLARMMSVSDRTLKRRFSKASGLSMSLYLQALRIDAARDRLATTDKPLMTIVTEIGYEDLSSFSRLFKQRMGITMQTYRKRFRII